MTGDGARFTDPPCRQHFYTPIGGTLRCRNAIRCYIRAFEKVRPGFPVNDIVSERRFSCRWYDNCLQYAAYRGWQYFSCHRCAVRDDVERPRMDVGRLLLVMAS